MRPVLPPLLFDEKLSISIAREEIIQAWQQSSILLIQSETGSGKSTQIPKIALQAFPPAENQWIGITQPRRLAAQILAHRLNQELQAPPGGAVGFQIRHQNKTLPQHVMKVMTEGVLVQEAINDPLLYRYNVLILDEVHERSLSIDLLCGLLKTLIQKRPALKIALLSATLDQAVFLKFFPKAQVLSYPGRSYPIARFYWEGAVFAPIPDRLLWALKQIEGQTTGDILIFCATESEIHGLINYVSKHYPHWECLPLYARMDPAKQSKVTRGASGHKRRAIFSTNIAETSLTIPGLSAVVDLGYHKILQYNPSLRINSYPIVPISQDSMIQRAGRAGRTGPGICYHLYTEEDASSRPQEREPEILRSGLAHVLLKILLFKGQKITSFSFLSPPKEEQIREALYTLELLNLIDSVQTLTSLGRQVAHDPIDPRFSIILREARSLKVLEEVSIIIACLSTNDPRLYPKEQKNKALLCHEQDRDYSSDFLTILNLYKRVYLSTEGLSRKKFYQYCEAHFLQPTLMSQWIDMAEEIAKFMQFKPNQEWMQKEYCSLLIHRALTSGFFDKVFLLQDDGLYRGARGITAKAHFPEKGAIKKPQWILSISIEEHSYGHFLRWVGPIAVMDLMHYGQKKCTSHRSHWMYCDQKRAAYVVEKTLLWGLPLTNGKRKWAQHSDTKGREVALAGLIFSEYENDFSSIPNWHHSFLVARTITKRICKQHLLKTPRELLALAIAQWPEVIFNGETLDSFASLIPPLKTKDFLVGDLDVSLEELPDSINLPHKEHVLIEYAEQQANTIFSMTIKENVWHRYLPHQWAYLHPFYRKEIVMTLLLKLPKNMLAQKEPLTNIAHFFLSEYRWPHDLISELKNFLWTYYEVSTELFSWSEKDIPKNCLPDIWIEDTKGNLHYLGLLECKKTSSQHFAQLSDTSHIDRDQEIYRSAQSGVYRYIAFDKKTDLRWDGQHYFTWRSTLLEDYAQTLYSSTRHPPVLLKKSERLLLIQIVLGIYILPGKDFLMHNAKEREKLCDRYNEWTRKNDTTISVLCETIRKLQTVKKPLWSFAIAPCEALFKGLFLCHGSPEWVERIGLWIAKAQSLDTKKREKAELCEHFQKQWVDFIRQSEIEKRQLLSPEHPVWALWFEWALSLLFQPYRPISPISTQRALSLSETLDDFKKPWA